MVLLNVIKRGAQMSNKNLYQYEILDRVDSVRIMIDALLVNHPAITKKQLKKVNKALTLLCNVYQSAGQKYYKYD